MKTCKVFWSGTSQSGNKYVGVEYAEGDFMVKKFLKLKDDADLNKYAKDAEIQVPTAALS